MSETSKTCKCCGCMKSIEEYSLNNNRRPIGVCKECRRHQQTLSNLRGIDPLTMSVRQFNRYSAAVEYMESCKAATGYETGKYSSRVGMPVASTTISASTTQILQAAYERAQTRRKKLAELGTMLPPPTPEILKQSTIEFLVECGYTSEECYDVLETQMVEDPEYDALWDRLIMMPR